MLIHKRELIENTNGTSKFYYEIFVESTETKPVPADMIKHSMCLEQDTGDFYYYTGTAGTPWAKIGD